MYSNIVNGAGLLSISSYASRRTMRKVSAILIMMFCTCLAGARESSCESIPELKRQGWPGYSVKECDCSADLASRFKVNSPKGMSLIAVCGQRDEGLGGYFFRGASKVTGEIKRNEYASGLNLHFHAPHAARYDRFASSLTRMKFIDEKAALKHFRAPALDAAAQCWKATAELMVSSILVLLGENDEAGNWPLEYRVLSVGKYEKCEPEA